MEFKPNNNLMLWHGL